MDGLQIFTNEEFGEIRTVIIDGDPWFVGKDVAKALGYSRTADAIKYHVEDEDKMHIKVGEIPTLQTGNFGVYVINESGLYSLIFASKLENAKRFKRWVTNEVLPAIRKNGWYGVGEVTEPTRPLTSDDYIRASHIVSRSKRETLPYALYFLTKAGFEIPRVQELMPGKGRGRLQGVNTSVVEYLDSHSVEDRASGEVYQDYVDFCGQEGLDPINHMTFSKQVNRMRDTKTAPIKINGKTVRVFVLA